MLRLFIFCGTIIGGASLQNDSEKIFEDKITIVKEIWSSLPVAKITSPVLEKKDFVGIEINEDTKNKDPEF